MQDKLKSIAKLQEIIEQQANDWSIWFTAEHASEAYLQEKLRELHAAVEEYVFEFNDEYNKIILKEQKSVK